jgi:uncharacterized protein GlcG (DUF336 family)
MSATAVVQLAGQRLELVRHPADGHVIAFESADDAFVFAVSLEIAGAASAGTVDAPAGELVHTLDPGVTAFDLNGRMEQAA